MDGATTQIEQQLTLLLRRLQRIPVATASGDVRLERSAYGILCQLADDGPRRLGELAAAFGLDPSTITRQVRSLEKVGLADRSPDPYDGRASILDLTPHGREALETTRNFRRGRLAAVMAPWSEEDRTSFGRLLELFNTSVEDMIDRG